MRTNLILLAAGYARRFGSQKLLVPVDGVPMYLVTLRKLEQIQSHRDGCHICVVTAEPEVEHYCNMHQICCIENTGAENTGIASSIKKAVTTLAAEDERCKEQASCDVFFTADQPFLSVAEVERFLKAYLGQKKKLGTMECRGQWRNPNIFDASLRKELLHLPEERGGKYLLQKHREEVFCFHTEDERQFLDIDTQDDYHKLYKTALGEVCVKENSQDFSGNLER